MGCADCMLLSTVPLRRVDAAQRLIMAKAALGEHPADPGVWPHVLRQELHRHPVDAVEQPGQQSALRQIALLRLLASFDAIRLGEGDTLTGANLLAAMAVALANLAPIEV